MKKKMIFFAVVLVVMLGTSVVYSATITVDGDETDWPASAGLSNDPGGDETGIPNNADIEYIKWTNNTSNMYFLVNTYTAPARLNNSSWLLICMDIDSNTLTGSTTSFLYYDNCNSQIGFDRVILLQSSFGTYSVGVGTVDNSNNISWNGSGNAYGYANNDLVEISAPLTSLFGVANCPSSITTVVYYDGGDTSPDDHTPDTGTVTTNCGAPTAVSLQNSTASSASPFMPVIVAIVIALVGTGVVLVRRQRA